MACHFSMSTLTSCVTLTSKSSASMFSLCSSCGGTTLKSLSQPSFCASSAHALRRTCHNYACTFKQASCIAVASPVVALSVMLLSMPTDLTHQTCQLHHQAPFKVMRYVNGIVMASRMADFTSFVLSSVKISVLESGWASCTS